MLSDLGWRCWHPQHSLLYHILPQGRGDEILEGAGCYSVGTENQRQQLRVSKAGNCSRKQLPASTVSFGDQRDKACWHLGLCHGQGLLQPEPLIISCKT